MPIRPICWSRSAGSGCSQQTLFSLSAYPRVQYPISSSLLRLWLDESVPGFRGPDRRRRLSCFQGVHFGPSRVTSGSEEILSSCRNEVVEAGPLSPRPEFSTHERSPESPHIRLRRGDTIPSFCVRRLSRNGGIYREESHVAEPRTCRSAGGRLR